MPSDVEVKDYKTWTMYEQKRDMERSGGYTMPQHEGTTPCHTPSTRTSRRWQTKPKEEPDEEWQTWNQTHAREFLDARKYDM